MTAADTAKKINELYLALKSSPKSSEEIARTINDILIFGDKVPSHILNEAWQIFAQEMGLEANN